MNADNELLASAYLDGELTDDERSIAEADPAVMAEVEQLRGLRSELADVEPPSARAREQAMTAAMGAFHEIHTPASTAAAPVVDIGRRRDPMRWMGVAAAVVVIGLLGVVLANGFGGGADDSASDSADEPASELAAVPVEEQAEERADDAGGGSDTAADRMTENATDDAEAEMAADEAPASEPAEESVAEGAFDGDAADDVSGEMADDTADDMADDTADDTADIEASDDAATSVPTALELLDPQEYLVGVPITNPEELTWVARHLLDLIERAELPPTPNHSCPFPEVLSRGVLLDGDAPVEVYIAVTPERRAVLAIDQELCRVLLRVELEP